MYELWTGETSRKFVINNHNSTKGTCVLYANKSTPININGNSLGTSHISISGLGSSTTLQINISSISSLSSISYSYYDIYAYTINANGTHSNIAKSPVVIYQTNNISVGSSLTLSYNESKQISVTQTSNAYYNGVKYVPSSSSIITVSSAGVVKGVGVGSATITVKPLDEHGSNKTINVTVNKATAKKTNPTAKTVTFNGSAQQIINAGSSTHGTFYYNTTNSDSGQVTSASDSKLKATNAGTYTRYWKFVANNNYNGSVEWAKLSCTINKASNSINASKTRVSLTNDNTSDIISLSVTNGSLSAVVSNGSDKIRTTLSNNRLTITLINATTPLTSTAKITVSNIGVSSNYNTASSITITVNINVKDTGDNSTTYKSMLII